MANISWTNPHFFEDTPHLFRNFTSVSSQNTAIVFSKARFAEYHNIASLSLPSCGEQSHFSRSIEAHFFIVSIHYDETTSCLVVLMPEPVLYKGHQLTPNMDRCILKLTIDTQSANQYSRVTASSTHFLVVTEHNAIIV